jgi:predicted ATP-binding protein involved in virulence
MIDYDFGDNGNHISIRKSFMKSSQIQQFKSMNIGDIVLIKNGIFPIALVQVTGEVKNLDFKFFRKTNILNQNCPKPNFKLSSVKLSKSVNPKTELFQYIDNCVKQLQQSQFQDLKPNEYKIKNIFIKDSKMFQDFELSFEDSDKKPLSLIVIAGKNGTGKTTILEYLSKYSLKDGDSVEIFKTDENGELDIFELRESFDGIREKKSEYLKRIEYLPVEVNVFGDLEKLILDYINRMFRIEKLNIDQITEKLQKYISEVFSGLDLTFNFSRVDLEDNIYFKNSSEKEFNINQLSTGEKTLVSKVLYLYFRDIKNKIILIDEPELSLHPSWQNRVLKLYENFAKNNNCQIVVATHSPHIIGSAKSETIRVLTPTGVLTAEKSYGLEFQKVLTDVMGLDETRTPEIEQEIKEIKELIYSNRFKDKKFQVFWEQLENSLGKTDLDLKLLKMEMDMRRKRGV